MLSYGARFIIIVVTVVDIREIRSRKNDFGTKRVDQDDDYDSSDPKNPTDQAKDSFPWLEQNQRLT